MRNLQQMLRELYKIIKRTNVYLYPMRIQGEIIRYRKAMADFPKMRTMGNQPPG